MGNRKGSWDKHRSELPALHIEVRRKVRAFLDPSAHLADLICSRSMRFLVLGKYQRLLDVLPTVPLCIYKLVWSRKMYQVQPNTKPKVSYRIPVHMNHATMETHLDSSP